MIRTFQLFALLLAAAVATAGCGWFRAEEKEVRTYELEGRVVAVDKRARQIVVAHEEIPGFMQAMTMGFPVKNARDLDRVQPDDRIVGTLYVEPDRSYLEITVIQRGPAPDEDAPEPPPPAPEPGTPVPDAALVDHDGRPLRLAELRGRRIALTFIYSRCPMPDVCPRLNRNFAATAEQLAADATAARRYELLSVTIDPEYDTPEVLRGYRTRFRRADSPAAVPWRFVTGRAEDIRALAEFFGLAYRGEGMNIVHTMRTVVVDEQGRVARVFVGNQWTPEELVAALRGE